MTVVFLSGSRRISRLNDKIRFRLQNIMKQNFQIFIGDANGADKAMQSYLADQHYPNVSIYFVGSICRNNIGNWNTKQIAVDKNLKGRAFYTEKDKAMAAEADFGFVLWDGISEGSINNIFELLNSQKKAVVYLSTHKKIFNIKTANDIENLINCTDPEALSKLQGLRTIRRQMEKHNLMDQGSFPI